MVDRAPQAFDEHVVRAFGSVIHDDPGDGSLQGAGELLP
jgi:hypothetical protein